MVTVVRPVRQAAAALALLAALSVLPGCGAAQDAVQGAQDAASAKASQAVEDAKAKASAKASELAVAAVKSQICALVKDGSLSDADTAALDGLVAAGKEAGLPAAVTSLAKTVADAGTGATDAQVAKLEASTCTA